MNEHSEIAETGKAGASAEPAVTSALPAAATDSHGAHEGHRGDKRERILDAALELFTERGFHGTPMPLVAELAGVGAGTIYRYFESKEAIVNALFQMWHTKLTDSVFGSIVETAPLREQFHVMFRRFIAFSMAHPTVFSFLNLHFHAPYLDGESRRQVEDVKEFAYRFFRVATEQQITKDLPPELLFFLVDGMFTGLFRAHLNGLVKLDGEVVDAVEECAWAAVRR